MCAGRAGSGERLRSMPPALTGNGNVLYFRCSDHARGKAPQKEARMETVRVAVIGVGNMGSAHAKTLHEGRIQGMHLVALCDHQPRRLEQLKAMYPDVACYAEYHEMLQKTALDAVVIAVPHPIHAEIAMECMEHGLHVLTEKPMDIKVSQARKALEVAERTGKIYAIMFNQRTNPLFQRAREIVRSGELGELKRTVWMITNWYRTQHYYDSGSWRATWAGEGGGVLTLDGDFNANDMSYSASINIEDVNVHHFMPHGPLYNVNIGVMLSGHGVDLFSPKTDIISTIYINLR